MTTTIRTQTEARFIKHGVIVHETSGFTQAELDTIVFPRTRAQHGLHVKMETREVTITTESTDWR